MKELEGWQGKETELRHVLARFLSYQENGWQPVSLFSTAWTALGRALSPVSTGFAVYQKEFWDIKAAEKVSAAPAQDGNDAEAHNAES